MSLGLPALAALAAALLELSVAPHLSLDGAHPQVVLVLGVIVTTAISPRAGLAWAFSGGLALDVLAGRPIGSTAFTLVVVLGGAGLIARSAPRFRLLATIALVPICSALGWAILLAVLGVLATPVAVPEPASLLAGLIQDTAISAAVAPVVLFIVDRRARVGHLYA
jgi:rod shape-determining protein MreD